MRFLMLNWRDPKNPKAGGAERVSLACLKALRERDHEVFWFANSYPGGPASECFEGIDIIRQGGMGSSVVRAIRWYKQQKKFDLVIDQHHGIPWFAPWWCKTNCVSYIHEVLGPIWSSFYPWPLSSIGRFQERATHFLYRNSQFWTVSDSTRDALLKNGVKKVKVFPNGTDTIPIKTLENKPLVGSITLIVVCRLAPNKRVDAVIDAFCELRKRNIFCRLVIVGTGEEAAKLRRQAIESPWAKDIDFTGALNELEKNAQLRNAHILLHASVREGWGLNVIEANAMGTPAVVYPVGGLVDSTVDGETGLLSKAETPGSLADSVLELVSDPKRYELLRRNAWERSKSFQWDRVLPPTCEWLEQQAVRHGDSSRNG